MEILITLIFPSLHFPKNFFSSSLAVKAVFINRCLSKLANNVASYAKHLQNKDAVCTNLEYRSDGTFFELFKFRINTKDNLR